MGRRKRRSSPNASNFMGAGNKSNAACGDMTQEEFMEMMKDIGKKKNSATRRKDQCDVMITINPLKDRQTPRFTFRIYNPPKGQTLVNGDKAVLYPMFDETRKRIYFMKNENGWTISSQDSKSTFIMQLTCNNKFEYLTALYNKHAIKHIEADWQFDNNVKLPYVNVDVKEEVSNEN